MEMILSGSMPPWLSDGSGNGSGSGYGIGYGSGNSYGSGSGYGIGYGSGSGNGSGNGIGYGYGNSYGSGNGIGYGYGNSYGSGNGNGYGYGSGNGYGDGSGYGSGYGYGSGNGSGSGSGSGYGSGNYWRACIAKFAKKWQPQQRARMAQLKAAGATIAYWSSNKSGQACNGGRNSPVSPGAVETINGPLEICTPRALHATLLPPKWKGNRLWIVALTGEVVGDEEKYGALSREIIGECL